MEKDQEFKYCCKLCGKIFPCGRSLGGHMKSHLINNHHSKADQRFMILDQTGLESSPQVGYGLRENPRKTWRIGEGSAYDHKVCRECGKRFQSWKGLVAHMKSHSNSSTNGFENNQDYCWTGSKVVDSQSENETSDNATRIKRSIRRSSKNDSLSVLNSKNDSLSVTEIEQEQQEEVAWCLVMLSRDVGHFGGLNFAADLDHITSDEDSEFSDAPSGLKMNRLSEIKITTLETFEVKKLKKMPHDEKTKLYSSNKRKHQYGYDHSYKRGKYECDTCNKVFRSYQALGGHRASHKKIKGCFASKIESIDNTAEFDTDFSIDHHPVASDHQDSAADESISTKSKGHSCPICLKVFRTGQALGGHKRSHLIVASSVSKNNQSSIDIPKQATHKVSRDFLDLNLPAPVEEESMSTNHVAAQALKPWWAGSSNHKPYEALVS